MHGYVFLHVFCGRFVTTKVILKILKPKPMKRVILPLIIFFSFIHGVSATKVLIPMDESQKNHLKAYGLAYWVLRNYDTEIDWLLNYRGGSFMMDWS